jgi:hypothetical protein
MSLLENLIAARALIADREHWCQGANAQADTGAPVNIDSPDAYCFCANGALGRACGVKEDTDYDDWTKSDAFDEASRALTAAANELFGSGYVDVNDGADTTADNHDAAYAEAHLQILRVFDHAIAKARPHAG